MIGMIVAGHGNFATGMTSGLKLLAGEPELYEAVDFPPECSIDELTEKLEGAMDRLKACEGILILTDLAGGSPYNVSVRLKMEAKRSLEVIGGTNLPVILDSYMSRSVAANLGALAASSAEAGKNQLNVFVLQEQSDRDSDDEYEE